MSSLLFQAAITGDDAALDEALGLDPELDDLTTMPGLSPLMLAARGGHLSIMARLLASGATLELANPQGLTALHVAAMANQRAATAALLEAGADPLRPMGTGGSAPHLAAAMGATAVLELLEARGIDLTEEDPQGRTPEDYAHLQGQQASLTFLRHRRLRDFYAQLQVLRAQVGALAHTLSDPPPPLPDDADTPLMVALPQDTVPDTSGVGAPRMRELAEALPAIDGAAWAEILRQHAAWLAAGGATVPGGWESLVQSEVVFALFTGPVEEGRGVQADLHVRRLEVASARGADLRRAHLVGLVAEEVDFSGSDLSGAMVTDAGLRGSSFEGASLRGADLSRADLRQVSFVGADLSHADLEGSDLRGADLRGAVLRGTRFPGADLRGALR